jgi:acyl-CoA reductase-like NAD-dependent aldehyde dehydrogenase
MPPETIRRTPATERVQYLFKLKGLIEAHLDELARSITQECGKTLAEGVEPQVLAWRSTSTCSTRTAR